MGPYGRIGDLQLGVYHALGMGEFCSSGVMVDYSENLKSLEAAAMEELKVRKAVMLDRLRVRLREFEELTPSMASWPVN